MVGAIEARLPVRECEGAELPTVLSGMSWCACIGSVVLLEEMLSVAVEGVTVEGVIVDAEVIEGVVPAREEVCLSLSESTRGSALLARSEAWGPEVVLLDVGSTAGPLGDVAEAEVGVTASEEVKPDGTPAVTPEVTPEVVCEGVDEVVVEGVEEMAGLVE